MMLVIHIGEHHECVDGVNPQIIPVPLMTNNTFTPLLPQTRGRMSRFEWQSRGVSLRTGRSGRGPMDQAPTSSQNQRPGMQSVAVGLPGPDASPFPKPPGCQRSLWARTWSEQGGSLRQGTNALG